MKQPAGKSRLLKRLRRAGRFACVALLFVPYLLLNPLVSPLRRLLGSMVFELREAATSVCESLLRWGRACRQLLRAAMGRFDRSPPREQADDLRTRLLRFRYLMQGIPATLVLVLATVATAVHALPQPRLIEQYRRDAARALVEDDLSVAQVACRRLMELVPDDPEARFKLALTWDKLGESPRAEELIESLAPRDRPGYVPAHLRLAEQAMSARPPSPEAAETARAHLEQALSVQPKSTSAHALMARLCLSRNEAALALPHLLAAADAYPELHLPLAQIQALTGHGDSARREARLAADHSQAQAERDLKDHEARIHWAESVSLLGDFPEAARILHNGLALDGKGAIAAALVELYVAWSQIAVADPQMPIESRRTVLREAIDVIQRYAPKNDNTPIRLARLHLALGQPAEAEAWLGRVPQARPALELELAQLYASKGSAEHSRELARRAADDHRKLLNANPADDRARLRAAEALLLLKEYPAAIELLEQGPGGKPLPSHTAALVDIYLAWYDDVAARSNQPTETVSADQLQRLRLALKHDPWNEKAVSRLLAAGHDSTEVADRSRNLLRTMLAVGDAPAVVHLLLGTDAFQRGEIAVGRRHLEQAHELDPRSADIANNLAWVLVHSNPPDLPYALELAEAAIKANPKQPVLRDTRGRVLAKMNRWKEALADLEPCLAAMKDDPEFHDVIAQAYEHEGLDDMATEHRRVARQLRAAATQVKR